MGSLFLSELFLPQFHYLHPSCSLNKFSEVSISKNSYY
jgi:hypothetical protein